ncbi:ATP phosphoribosyltransferase HisG(S)Z, hetero-octameric short form, catalytic subunit [Campylobacter ureolyticus RIGS 9880]|uniref:ATP phosphoribosyltransferase n=1 Tax=Campylobacter ureolyticus RIGS 9880 TaxID=1032069 RepID=A0AAU8U0N5_9BACT|nr:ATP phosphoribosyltransferase [Campylobacter ureolyticus]AKT91225.1 ATP phosphoribosyltransferase HisG(S)Z, hetero-octameric short form, catalytic subunit [Campylobacter ureolyticus RIGS 9880]
MITIALPKGRIANETLEIFEKVFKKEFVFEDRKLILNVENFKFLAIRSQDVSTYVENGAADIGIVGLDVLEEHKPNVLRLLDLGIGKCKVCVGIQKDKILNYDKPNLTVATKMTNITKEFFAKKATPVSIIKLYGSIELAPLIGLSDLIVDNVETGATMKQNGLKVAETIMDSSAFLISNKNSFINKKIEILEIYDKISAVL